MENWDFPYSALSQFLQELFVLLIAILIKTGICLLNIQEHSLSVILHAIPLSSQGSLWRQAVLSCFLAIRGVLPHVAEMQYLSGVSFACAGSSSCFPAPASLPLVSPAPRGQHQGERRKKISLSNKLLVSLSLLWVRWVAQLFPVILLWHHWPRPLPDPVFKIAKGQAMSFLGS